MQYETHMVSEFVQGLVLQPCLLLPYSVADSGGVRGVQMHPPLAASNVFLRT